MYCEIIIKPKNRIECISRNGDYHGFFVIRNIDIVLSAKNPRDLEILMKFKHKIEEQIVDYLNFKSYRKDKEQNTKAHQIGELFLKHFVN